MPVLSQCSSRVPGWKRPGLAPALVPSGIGCCVQGLTGHPAPSPMLLGFSETDGLQRFGGGRGLGCPRQLGPESLQPVCLSCLALSSDG